MILFSSLLLEYFVIISKLNISYVGLFNENCYITVINIDQAINFNTVGTKMAWLNSDMVPKYYY